MPRQFTVPSLLPGLIEDLDIFKIKQPKKMLRQANNIDELAYSIMKKGLLQPIVVRTNPDNEDTNFEIVAGNRRYLACRSLGWKKITSHIVELDDREAFEISIVENIQRNTLSPLEEAQAFKTYVSDYGWGGVSDLSAKIGKSISYVTKRIKLLGLPHDVLQAIINSSITVSTAEELSAVKNASKQSELSALISRRHLSLRKVRELVKDIDDNASSKRQHKDEDIFLPTTDSDHSLEDAQRALDKSMIALKIALNRLATIIDEYDDKSIVHEMLMYHKSVLHEQIDLLLKEKKKANRGYISAR
jgi:ParB family chromosome partitioning protein